MISDIFRWFTGIGKFAISKENSSSASCLLHDNGIRFRTKTGSEYYVFLVYGGNVRIASDLFKANAIEVFSFVKSGLPVFISFLTRRPAFIPGMILFAFTLFLSSHVVWDIRIDGNNRLSENRVIEILEDCGFTYGTYIPEVDFDDLNSSIIARYNDIAWISVNMRGTIAEVALRETEFGPATTHPEGLYSNIIASDDGQISAIHTDGGSPSVKIGDIVKKGQLLVSGVIPLREGGVRYDYPVGEVLAETEKIITVDVLLKSERKEYTGRENNSYAVKFFKKTYNLFANGGFAPTIYDKIEKQERVSLFGFLDLPVWITKKVKKEYSKTDVVLSPDEAVAIAYSELKNEMDLILGDSELLKKTVVVSADNENIKIKCTMVVLKNIADTVEFSVK